MVPRCRVQVRKGRIDRHVETGNNMTMVVVMTMEPAMMTVPKGVLKAKMLAYFRLVEETGETLIVTDRRKPVLKVEPIRARASLVSAFADLQGKLKAREEDLLAPNTIIA